MPYCPYKCIDFHSYIYFLTFDDAIQPISEKMINTGRRSNIKGHINYCPNNLGKRTLNEKMLYCLLIITETTCWTPLQVPFYQIIFC
jgi:Fe-S-cluster containining protein